MDQISKQNNACIWVDCYECNKDRRQILVKVMFTIDYNEHHKSSTPIKLVLSKENNVCDLFD